MSQPKVKNEASLDQIENSKRIQESLALHFSSSYPYEIDRKTILEALFIVFENKYNLEWLGDIWNIQLNYDKALILLSDFDFNILQNVIETEEDIIQEKFRIQYKAKIKSKGLIWVIHKNDADHFPSNPHAHELCNNIKLDLSSGRCYRKKEYLFKLKRKDLMSIRNVAIIQHGIELPTLKI